MCTRTVNTACCAVDARGGRRAIGTAIHSLCVALDQYGDPAASRTPINASQTVEPVSGYHQPSCYSRVREIDTDVRQGVTARPGARFGPKGIRQGSRRISPDAGWSIYTGAFGLFHTKPRETSRRSCCRRPAFGCPGLLWLSEERFRLCRVAVFRQL